MFRRKNATVDMSSKRSKKMRSKKSDINKLYIKSHLVERFGKEEVVEEHRFAYEFVGKGKGLRARLEEAGLQDWRFDYAIPDYKFAVEYEGIFSTKSRHTTVSGYTGDTNKYNAAAILGWVVLRYTATNLQRIERDIDLLIKTRLDGVKQDHTN